MSAALDLLPLGFAAGALTILSPCVLPLVPIVLGSAAQRDRFGPFALTGGLVLSFTSLGLALAASGVSAAPDADLVRFIGAVALILIGIVTLVDRAQVLLNRIVAPIANWASHSQTVLDRYGLIGQAAIGALLGLVWSPCVGPTLGAATVLASQGKNLSEAALVMLAFGLGIASTLLAIAVAARSMLSRWRGRLMRVGGSSKPILGGLLIAVGLLIITGLDHQLEGVALAISPQWLTDLVARF